MVHTIAARPPRRRLSAGSAARTLAVEPAPLCEAVSSLADIEAARRRTADYLSECGISGDHLADCLSVVAELVANAVTHGSPPALVSTQVRASSAARGRVEVVVRVYDAAPGRMPRLLACAPMAEHGRGLRLVDTLAQHWGSYPPLLAPPTSSVCTR